MMKVKLLHSTGSNVNKGMRFASGSRNSASDTLERQTMRVNKYASTFPMASCDKKRCNYRRKKHGVKKYENTQLFCKYTIEDYHVA